MISRAYFQKARRFFVFQSPFHGPHYPGSPCNPFSMYPTNCCTPNGPGMFLWLLFPPERSPAMNIQASALGCQSLSLPRCPSEHGSSAPGTVNNLMRAATVTGSALASSPIRRPRYVLAPPLANLRLSQYSRAKNSLRNCSDFPLCCTQFRGPTSGMNTHIFVMHPAIYRPQDFPAPAEHTAVC